MFGIGTQELIMLLLTLVLMVVFVFPVWRILVKIGFPGWYSLAVLFPPLMLVLFYFLAFAEWPVLSQGKNSKHM